MSRWHFKAFWHPIRRQHFLRVRMNEVDGLFVSRKEAAVELYGKAVAIHERGAPEKG